MFSEFDNYKKRLFFYSINCFKSKNLGNIYYPKLYQTTKEHLPCSYQLQNIIGIIFEHSEHLIPELFDGLVDSWLMTIYKWKHKGISLAFFEDINNFLNKRSIVIDQSVFLISAFNPDLDYLKQNSDFKRSFSHEQNENLIGNLVYIIFMSFSS